MRLISREDGEFLRVLVGWVRGRPHYGTDQSGKLAAISSIFGNLHFWNAVPKMENYFPKIVFFSKMENIKDGNANDAHL